MQVWRGTARVAYSLAPWVECATIGSLFSAVQPCEAYAVLVRVRRTLACMPPCYLPGHVCRHPRLPVHAVQGLMDELVESTEKLKWTAPTPIQVAAIPHGLKGSDVIGLAETGASVGWCGNISTHTHTHTHTHTYTRRDRCVGRLVWQLSAHTHTHARAHSLRAHTWLGMPSGRNARPALPVCNVLGSRPANTPT